jgi:hypothetical protein
MCVCFVNSPSSLPPPSAIFSFFFYFLISSHLILISHSYNIISYNSQSQEKITSTFLFHKNHNHTTFAITITSLKFITQESDIHQPRTNIGKNPTGPHLLHASLGPAAPAPFLCQTSPPPLPTAPTWSCPGPPRVAASLRAADSRDPRAKGGPHQESPQPWGAASTSRAPTAGALPGLPWLWPPLHS